MSNAVVQNARPSEEKCRVVLRFMLDMLDAILFKSVHVLLQCSLQSISSLAYVLTGPKESDFDLVHLK